MRALTDTGDKVFAYGWTLHYKVNMTLARLVATSVELLFISPAVLFMTALFVRNLQPQKYEPARTAQQIVVWYAARPHTGLWLFLIAMPALVLFIGCATLWRRWHKDAQLREAARQFLNVARRHLDTLLVGGASLTAIGVLGIVALHALTD
ncbi:MAG: hypothetical protein JO340_18155 [Acidobacteriaceae bacterium]|nr:hypothetical protein [Acidobacteriaceae bacterium]